MLLRTKLHGKTHEFLETGGFDTPFATKRSGLLNHRAKMILSSFVLSLFLSVLRVFAVKKESQCC